MPGPTWPQQRGGRLRRRNFPVRGVLVRWAPPCPGLCRKIPVGAMPWGRADPPRPPRGAPQSPARQWVSCVVGGSGGADAWLMVGGLGSPGGSLPCSGGVGAPAVTAPWEAGGLSHRALTARVQPGPPQLPPLPEPPTVSPARGSAGALPAPRARRLPAPSSPRRRQRAPILPRSPPSGGAQPGTATHLFAFTPRQLQPLPDRRVHSWETPPCPPQTLSPQPRQLLLGMELGPGCPLCQPWQPPAPTLHFTPAVFTASACPEPPRPWARPPAPSPLGLPQHRPVAQDRALRQLAPLPGPPGPAPQDPPTQTPPSLIAPFAPSRPPAPDLHFQNRNKLTPSAPGREKKKVKSAWSCPAPWAGGRARPPPAAQDEGPLLGVLLTSRLAQGGCDRAPPPPRTARSP